MRREKDFSKTWNLGLIPTLLNQHCKLIRFNKTLSQKQPSAVGETAGD